MKLLLIPEDEALIVVDQILYAHGLTESQKASRRDDVQTIVVLRRGEVHLTIDFADYMERLFEAISKS